MRIHTTIVQSLYFRGFALWLILVLTVLLVFDKATLFLWVNSHHHPLLDGLFTHFTHVGDGLFFFSTSLIFIVVNRRWAFHFFAAFVLSSLISIIFKEWLFHGVPRPKHHFESLGVPIRMIEGVSVHSFNSFPSGHTLSAFAVFFLIALYFSKPLLSVLALLLAILAGFSRIYIAQHFALDVFAGSIIGVASVCITFILLEAQFKRYDQDVINRPLIRLTK